LYVAPIWNSVLKILLVCIIYMKWRCAYFLSINVHVRQSKRIIKKSGMRTFLMRAVLWDTPSLKETTWLRS